MINYINKIVIPSNYIRLDTVGEHKDINVTIVTPGLGDTPKWMSTELGSTFAQFKKFAMSSTQRMSLRHPLS